jgi:hypothetical protein
MFFAPTKSPSAPFRLGVRFSAKRMGVLAGAKNIQPKWNPNSFSFNGINFFSLFIL